MWSPFRLTPGVPRAKISALRDRSAARPDKPCYSMKIVLHKLAALQDGQQVPVGMLKN